MSSSYIERAITPARKAVAARVAEVTREVPHFRVVREVELDHLIAVQESLRAASKGGKVTLTDLFVKACAGALMDVPAVNIHWAGDALREFASADIAVAMSVNSVVQTPIIWQADRKSVPEIHQELALLKEKASRNELKMREIAGGSFTISNLGMYGIDQFDAIINAPQCAILATGRGTRRVVVRPDGNVDTATISKLTLSVDHRAIDGALAARFMDALCRRLEHWSQVHEGVTPKASS